MAASLGKITKISDQMPKVGGSGKKQQQLLLAIADKKLIYGFYTVG